MSHCGPAGPAGNSSRFTETFSSDDTIACNFYGGGLKLLLINYGTRGDRIAIDDLLTASANCERLEFKAVNARDVTPEFMRQHLNDRWCVVIDPDNSNYVGAAGVYDCNGQHYGWRGGPGCRGFNGFPDATRIHYQLDGVEGDKIVVSNKEGASVEHLGNLMENCAFFDKPDEIHVVLSDDQKLVTLTYTLRDKVSEHFTGPVKLVSYADSLLTNQCTELKIVYVAVSGARRGHEFDYEQYRGRKMVRKHDGSYVWSRDNVGLGAPMETFSDRMNRLGISGGFRPGEAVVLGATTTRRSPLIPVMDEPAHIGGIETMTVPRYGSDWSVLTMPISKRPKGPITMPGIGERKKKGKHRGKY